MKRRRKRAKGEQAGERKPCCARRRVNEERENGRGVARITQKNGRNRAANQHRDIQTKCNVLV